MSQPTAIVIAALVAVVGYLFNHALGRWAERKRAEERAVTQLATAAMSVLSISRFRAGFADGPAWRQFLRGSPPAMPTVLAIKLVERGFLKMDEVVEAHGELLQHAQARLVDAATDVLNASSAITDAWNRQDRDASDNAAEYQLGQARLRLYELSRGRRSWRWRLRRPAVFNNIDKPQQEA